MKRINRKEFFEKAFAGIAAIKLSARKIVNPVQENSGLKQIGKTGIMVSPVCFGAPRTNDESLIKYAIDKGINFIDTGRAYGNGNNEKLVGRAVEGKRKSIVIQSKIRLEENELSSKSGRKRASEIKDALSVKLDASLKALNTDYIDVLLYHDAIDEKLLFHEETMKFFADMKKSGVIKAHGFSVHNDFMNLPERNNSEVFYNVIMAPFNHKGSFIHSVSGNYSEWDQSKLIQILKDANSKGIGVIAMKTCSGGKYSASSGSEPDFREAVQWVLKHDFINSANVAMANFEQVDEYFPLLKTN